MSSQETATKFAAAEGFTTGDNQVAPASNRGLGRGGAGKQKEALKLRLDLNLEVEIAIQAKVNGDITLSLLLVAFRVARNDQNASIAVSIWYEFANKPKIARTKYRY
ncbi:uncharacterized protein ARMOST_19669 [Armillaria ostoyae]|uniref:Uncharacterized protein n=2 Tax=Armillaria TaxID=47424 RepID=A0A284S579_ARMOS|nr:uncharacterized protein ARMOST_19669 [Armillaria ostoyae]